jgi:hypothetical protein
VTGQQIEELVAIYRNTSNSLAGGCSWQESHALALEAVARYAIEHADRLGLASVASPEQLTALGALADHMTLLAELLTRLDARTSTLEGAYLPQRLALLEAVLGDLARADDRGAKSEIKGFVAVKEP